MAQLSSVAKKITQQNRREVVTAVCKISRNLGKERQSVGQGCLVQTKQSNECCVVTADKVIPDGQLDTCEVEFTKKDSKPKSFFLKDIKKEVKYVSGLVKIVIDLDSPKLKHGKNTCSIFTKSPVTITALDKSKKQFCYIDRKCYNLQVSNESTIEFHDHAPSTIPDGLVILQTSNSTDHNVIAVGIQSQVDGNHMMPIWMNEILEAGHTPATSSSTIPVDIQTFANGVLGAGHGSSQGNQDPSASLTATAHDPPPMSEPPNPESISGTASNQTPINGGDQQPLTTAAAAAYKPGDEPQNPVLNNGTAVDDNTDVSHTSSTDNEDLDDCTAPAAGDADHNPHRTAGASSLDRINGDFLQHENGLTSLPIQVECGASDQQDGTVTENIALRLGFESRRRPSPTEHSHRSIQEPANTKRPLIVNLPPVNVKEKPTMMEVQPDSLVSQQAVTDGKDFGGGTLNIVIPQGKQRVEGYDNEGRRHSFPDCSPKKEEQNEMKRCFSELTMKKKRKINLEDPLAKTILDCLDLLEGLSRILDKEYKYGSHQCWKHIADYFDIDEEEYQNFKCSKVHSPTEGMFEYLQTTNPEITIKELKDGLCSVGRQDVINVLEEYGKTDCSVNDDTEVCSLFDSNPDIIGHIAFLLDRQKVGLKNWDQLAGKLGIPRKDFKSFDTCNTNNPTEDLFESLNIRFPKTTVEELITHLNDMQRRDVVIAIKKSTKVKSGSLIKDLMGDLLVMDEVCELLNRKPRTVKVLGWKHLGARFNIDKVTLHDLSPPEDIECPTEALIRHLGSSKPDLKIEDFIRALYMIKRPDAIAVLEDYLPGGCVSDLVRSYRCERCHVNGNENSQGP